MGGGCQGVSRVKGNTIVDVNIYWPWCPSPSSLVWVWVDRHNGLVNTPFGTDVSGCFVLGHVLVCATHLMVRAW